MATITKLQMKSNYSKFKKILPDEKNEAEPFAILPKLVSCIKVSMDHKYVAVGCQDGYMIIY